MMSLCDFRFS